MESLELSPAAQRVLAAIAEIEKSGRVQTVQDVANTSGVDFSIVFDLLSALFNAGLVTPDLRLTTAGQQALS